MRDNNVVTPEEYKELIAKDEPTPVELMKTKQYEDYLKSCQFLEELDLGFGTGLTPESAEPIIAKTNANKLKLLNKENKTKHEEEVLKEFKKTLENNQEENLTYKEEGPTRKLKKAGYIDITIILFAILNIGFIIAMAMLRK